VASLRALNWKLGLAAAAIVLAVGGLCALAADDECNHLVGDIAVAERGTPRGARRGAVQWDQRWLAVLLVPATLTHCCSCSSPADVVACASPRAASAWRSHRRRR
jgi:hypothetical protein